MALASGWNRRWTRALCALLVTVAIGACTQRDARDSDDAFIAPSGDNSEVSEPSRENAGAGDAGAALSGLEAVYFAFDSSVVSGTAVDSLKRNADWLRDNPSASIQIEGHCDERGTVEYNLALGERRAAAARGYLVKLGVEKSRMSIISLGEERPTDSGHDESAWSRNRRAEFVATNLP